MRKGTIMKLEIIATAGSMLLLGACVTRPATSAEYASCQAMERDMGVADRHDHGEMKGQGRNAMNLSHDRCRQILSQPAPARRSEEHTSELQSLMRNSYAVF